MWEFFVGEPEYTYFCPVKGGDKYGAMVSILNTLGIIGFHF